MKTDAELLTYAVYLAPNDEGAKAAMADAIMETGVSPERAAEAVDTAVLTSRIDAFLNHLDTVMADHWRENNYTFAPPPVHEAVYKSKWCLIVRKDKRGDGSFSGGSATAFVALEDFTNRTLGTVFRGDIHKPANYTTPAKHARGNVFREDFGNCVGPSGHINYLR